MQPKAMMGNSDKSLARKSDKNHNKTKVSVFSFFSASLCSILLCHCKWFSNLFSPTIHNDNILVWLVPPVSRVLLNRSHNIHSLHNFSKHHMPAVKPRRLLHRDEEL